MVSGFASVAESDVLSAAVLSIYIPETVPEDADEALLSEVAERTGVSYAGVTGVRSSETVGVVYEFVSVAVAVCSTVAAEPELSPVGIVSTLPYFSPVVSSRGLAAIRSASDISYWRLMPYIVSPFFTCGRGLYGGRSGRRCGCAFGGLGKVVYLVFGEIKCLSRAKSVGNRRIILNNLSFCQPETPGKIVYSLFWLHLIVVAYIAVHCACRQVKGCCA